MTESNPYKTKQFFFVLVKIGLVLAAFYFIYSKVFLNSDLKTKDLNSFISQTKLYSIKNMGFLILLSFLNWFLEVSKWKILVKPLIKITFLEALEQSLASLTASIFTPNKIAEYGVKAMYFAPSERKKIVLLKLLGNLSQLGATIIFGIFGLLIFVRQYNPQNTLLFSTIFILVCLLGITFIIKKLSQKDLYVKGYAVNSLFRFYKAISIKFYVKIWTLSLLRYLVFSFQFFVLLNLAGVQLSYFDSMIIVSSMYLLASLVPTVFILDLAIKGSIGIYLFSYAGVNELTILGVTSSMWILNWALPAILGSYFVLKFKFPDPVSA